MLTKQDFIKYKSSSYTLGLKKLAHSSTNPLDFKMVYFGGTGAVGGQAVIECIENFNFIKDTSQTPHTGKPQLIITGINSSQIHQFCDKLFHVFGKENFVLTNGNADLPEYTYNNFIKLQFLTLLASPQFQVNLSSEIVRHESKADKIKFLISEASQTTSPFEAFLTELKVKENLSSDYRFQAVFSGIPVPSVATYHFEAIDRLLDEHGLADDAKEVERSIKKEILKGLAADFGDIKLNHAVEVLMAHTTSVGGMYEIINGEPTIKLGYAHSSLGDLLKEKQFYANELTIQYSNFKLKSLVTASAIGIDYIYDSTSLPLSSGVSRKFRRADELNSLPFSVSQIQEESSGKLINKVFPSIEVDLNSDSNENIQLDQQAIKPLAVSYALRSGENGLFSLDNAYSLYINMKIASQEELAHVLVSNAFIGDDPQRPWFDDNGICYYTQTDNSSLVFALLNNRKEFRRHQTSAFTCKAFQELGSSKHQAELHTHGLYILMHKLRHLKLDKAVSKWNGETTKELLQLCDHYTHRLLLEDVVEYGKNPVQTAASFAELIEINTEDDLISFCGQEVNSDKHKSFIKILLDEVKFTINRITSLGTPIVYSHQGKDKIISGPYFAPLDLVVGTENSVASSISTIAEKHNLDKDTLIQYLICNNGCVDLRPNATINTADVFSNGLDNKVMTIDNKEAFRDSINQIKLDNGKNLGANLPFNTSGVLAYCERITGLFEQLEEFDLRLGTYNAWKALFPIDQNGNHVLIPGLVEAMRHYSEGLGKITGTEFLYPGYGYYK